MLGFRLWIIVVMVVRRGEVVEGEKRAVGGDAREKRCKR